MLWHCQHYQSKPVSVAVSHQLDNKTEIKVILFPKVSFFLTINHSFSQQKLTVFIFWLYLEFLIFQNTVFRIFFSADENMYNVECDQICSNFLNAMQYHTICKMAIREPWLSFQPFPMWDWDGSIWQYLILQLSWYAVLPVPLRPLLLSGVICRQSDTACKQAALGIFLPFVLWSFAWESSAFIHFLPLKLLSAIICSSLIWWWNAKECSSRIFPWLDCSPNKLEVIYSH